jgi:two-component system OmpR family response regulator
MNDTAHILVVDDEPEICAIVKDYLTDEGYKVSAACDGSDMRRIIEQSPVDLILLDVMLPREDGLSLIRSLRAENRAIRVIMLSGRGDTIDRIVGLEMGADDYLTKPFSLRELLARVKSVMRRSSPASADMPPRLQARFAGWRLDRATRELFSPEGENIPLTGGEFDLLVAFITNPHHVLSRERLLDLARDREAGPFDRTIDVQVGRLRRKLNEDAQRPQLIKTVRGGGYLFNATVEITANPQ